jgi:hypothetical protein
MGKHLFIRWQMGIMLALLSGLVPIATTALAQEQLADLKPLVGKWRGSTTSTRGTVPMDLTIQEDGSYSAVAYTKPSRTITGALQLVDGKVRFKTSEGTTGTFILYVDAKGKRVLKTVRDDGSSSSESEPLK